MVRARVHGSGAVPLLDEQVIHTIAFDQHLQFTGNFTANSATSRLEFESQNSGLGGIAIDSILVEDLDGGPAVPSIVAGLPLATLVVALCVAGSVVIGRGPQRPTA